MNLLLSKKPRKSLKYSQRDIFSGINTAIGPLGFRVEPDTGPNDEESSRGSRIVFQGKTAEDQEVPAPEGSTPSVVVGDTDNGSDPLKQNGGTGVAKRDWKDTARGGAGILFDVAMGAAEAFTPLKATLGAISAVYTNYQETIAVGEKIQRLCSRIEVLETTFQAPSDDGEEQTRRDGLLRKFKDIEGQLRPLADKSALQQFAEHSQDKEEVSAILEDLQEVISDYQMVQQMAIHKQTSELMDAAEAAVLGNFRCAREAEYRHGDRKGCLKGTRKTILDEIERWMSDFGKPPVYWLNGLAGTGKSAIAQTIAEKTFADGKLGASFFCSRGVEDRSNLKFIFPTLAVQLAHKYPEIRSILVRLIRADSRIAGESLNNQMDKLIVRPLKETAISTVIVIDALDECEDEEPASAILSVLRRFVSELPKVKFFVTGRPDPHIRAGFRPLLLAEATDVFVLHKVDPLLVNSDIRRFLKHSFMEIAQRRPGMDDWPSEEQLDLLCERAAGLFVYAVATIKFLDHKNNDPRGQLDRLLQSSGSGVREGRTRLKAKTTLDSLYSSILVEAFDDDEPEDDPKTRSVLGAVVLAVNPLSPCTIAALLGFRITDVALRLSSVHSLLLLEEDNDSPVRPFHKSFPDFITDPERCVDGKFRVFPPDHHFELLIGCLELMNRGLEKNMCKLPDGVTNSEVGDLGERADQYINAGLQYACRSWHKHLIGAVPSRMFEIEPTLLRFLEGKFLFWLEVLSVLGAVREAVDALDAVARQLNASATLDLVNDFLRFVVAFFEVISTSAPHIYHSALPLSPRTSTVRKLYEPCARPLARVVHGISGSWEPILTTVKHCSHLVERVAWSPCSRYIAVFLSFPNKIEVLDAATLEKLHTLEPNGGFGWLSFSPDSRLLTEFNNRHYGITTWDLRTGSWISTTPPPLHKVSVTLSSTYSMDGKMVAAHTCTDIIIYNLLSGAPTYFYRVHESEGCIMPSIWTHGECLRFITAKPGSITVWEVGFTSTHTLAKVESLPVPNYVSYQTHTTLFLPALFRLAFVHEQEVAIWDARGSKFVLLIDFRGYSYPNLSFSPDGRFFACHTYLWKESPTGYIFHRKLVSGAEEHSEGFNIDGCPKPFLSPDGASLAMSRHHELQLWRTTDPITSHFNIPIQPAILLDFLLEFLPDGSLAAAARWRNNMVTVLDLKSGNPPLVIDMGVEIWNLRVTGKAIIVVGDGKIITRNLPIGDRVLDARATIDDSVPIITLDRPTQLPLREGWFNSAAISPNLKYTAITRWRAVEGEYGYDEDSEDYNRIWDDEDEDEKYLEGDGLDIYSMSTGNHIVGTTTAPDTRGPRPLISPDGYIWHSAGDGYKITKDETSNEIGLEPLPEGTSPLGGHPWISSHGHRVTDDGWIFSSREERLMWLPHHWRQDAREDRVWAGRFLGLLNRELPEPIIIDLGE